MKSLISILFILFAVVFSELGVQLLDIAGDEICLIDCSGEGESERDTKDASEDDTELDYLNSAYDLAIWDDHNFVCHLNTTLKSHFLEIPSPPPDLI